MSCELGQEEEGDTMNKITLTFSTVKGEQAYRSVEEEGKKQPWRDRKISEKVCTEKIVNKKPLTVEITIKIGWLAVQIDLPTQIKTGLAKFGAHEGDDYTMDIQ